MVAVAEQHPNKIRWGELEEEDDVDNYAYLLPPPVVVGHDENGVKKLIEYRFTDAGDKVNVTTTTTTTTTIGARKLARARLSKKALERCNWAKFGDAVHEDAGSGLTTVSTEEILLERPRPPGSVTEEGKTPDPLAAAAAKAGAVLMVCRTCHKKGDHWTAQCPYKDLAAPTDTFVDKPSAFSWLQQLRLVPFSWCLCCLPFGSVAEEVKTPDPLAAAAAKAGAVLMVCRTCHKKGDHWTAQCPYKDLAAPTDTFVDKRSASEAAPAAGARSGTCATGDERRRRQ